jgi:ribosomal subunit interface protein
LTVLVARFKVGDVPTQCRGSHGARSFPTWIEARPSIPFSLARRLDDGVGVFLLGAGSRARLAARSLRAAGGFHVVRALVRPVERRVVRRELSMQTQVSILHHDYPSQVRETVDGRLQHLTKFHDRIVSLRALLERDHDAHRVELVASVGHGAVLVVDARDEGFTTALDEALRRMERLLKRQNERHGHDRRRRRDAS